MEGIGVAKAVNSLKGNLQSTPDGPRLKCFDHGRWFQSATRCLEPKEHLPIGAIAGDLHQIVVNRSPDRIRQWEFQRVARLALANAQTSASPQDVVEGESYDIARAQAIGCDQRENGVITFADRGIPVDGT